VLIPFFSRTSSSPQGTPSLGDNSGSTSTKQGSTTASASTAVTTGSGTSSSDSFWTREQGIGSIVGIIVGSVVAIATLVVAIKAYKFSKRKKMLRQRERMSERDI
jgi:hypothetical protein